MEGETRMRESHGVSRAVSSSSCGVSSNSHGVSSNLLIGSGVAPVLEASPRHGSAESDASNTDSRAVTKQILRAECQTWHRDSHELFDYESRHVDLKHFALCKPTRFFRTGIDVACVQDGAPLPESADYLLSIRVPQKDQYILCPAERNVVGGAGQIFAKKLWTIVRDLPNHRYALEENDVIKLGRFKLRVKQLCHVGDEPALIRLDDPTAQLRTYYEEPTPGAQCRICLAEAHPENSHLEGEPNPETDPLICPCECKGSIKYVHVECLKQWINGRLNLSATEQDQAYFLKHVLCELCKAAFPTTMRHHDEQIQLLQVPETTPPFIVLENMMLNRGIHVISMAEKKDLKIGRGHESDVRIPDVSISRHHATIRYANGHFLLEDHNSKFGTLVALKKAHALSCHGGLSVQVGRSIMAFSTDAGAPGGRYSWSRCGTPVIYADGAAESRAGAACASAHESPRAAVEGLLTGGCDSADVGQSTLEAAAQVLTRRLGSAFGEKDVSSVDPARPVP